MGCKQSTCCMDNKVERIKIQASLMEHIASDKNHTSNSKLFILSQFCKKNKTFGIKRTKLSHLLEILIRQIPRESLLNMLFQSK